MRESFFQDLRFGLRLLKRKPAFAAAVVVSLALGVGSSTAVFTVLDAVLWRPIHAEQPDRLVSFYGTLRDPSGQYLGSRAFSYEDFADIRGRRSWQFTGDNPNPYVQEHRDLIAGITGEGARLNEARTVAESTLTAIMGRMSAYTGKTVTWEQALENQLDLRPPVYEFGPVPVRPVAIPGRTPLV